MSKMDLPDIRLKPFAQQGVEFDAGRMSGSDYQADCPFCGKVRKFHVDPETTSFICSSSPDVCGRSGNLTTFLREWHAVCLELTSEKLYETLSKQRDGLPAKALRRWELAYNAITGEWLIPLLNPEGNVHDLRRWRRGRACHGSYNVKAGMWNASSLFDKRWAKRPVDIVEGEFDGIAMWCWHKKAMLKRLVVGVPGANILKDEWAPWFRGRDVTFWFDNDASGLEYSLKKARVLFNHAASVRWHIWPKDFPEKYDVRDHYCREVLGRGRPAKAVWREATTDIVGTHPLGDDDDTSRAAGESSAAKPPRQRPETNPTFEATLEHYARWLDMREDLCDALKVLFATTLSQQIDADPLWTFLVGPPGSGKTELLQSLRGVPDIAFYSTVTAKSLVSGFNAGKVDPSILPKIIEAGVGVFKDFTELLGESNRLELAAVSRTLRGAYDGYTERPFGNTVMREYVGRFTLMAGVTEEIHSFTEATMGERFCKFQLQRLSRRQKRTLGRRVVFSTGVSDAKDNSLQDAACAFLDRDVAGLDPVAIIGDAYCDRICALAELVATLRHQVMWNWDQGQGRVLKYRPETEVGTRLARQLTSLAMALTVIDRVEKLGPEQYRLVERVAFDTGIGFNLDIVTAMMEQGREAKAPLDTICEVARINKSTLRRRLEDLEVIGAVRKVGKRAGFGPGQPQVEWQLAKFLRDLWTEAAPGETHMKTQIEARPKRVKRLRRRKRK